MQTFKVLIGILAILLAWIFIFKIKWIFQMNAWIREHVFSDKVVLFSGRRMAMLLLVLGGVSLFSGIDEIVDEQPIRTNIASQMMDQARMDFRSGRYPHVVRRCRELVRSDPKNTEAWELLANALWAMGRKTAAIQTVDALMSSQPAYQVGKGPLKTIFEEKNKIR